MTLSPIIHRGKIRESGESPELTRNSNPAKIFRKNLGEVSLGTDSKVILIHIYPNTKFWWGVNSSRNESKWVDPYEADKS